MDEHSTRPTGNYPSSQHPPQIAIHLNQPFVFPCHNNDRGLYYLGETSDFCSCSEILQELLEAAQTSGSSVVLNIGLHKGLAGLIASHALAFVDQIRYLDICVQLWKAEPNGHDTVQWTVENFDTNFPIHPEDPCKDRIHLNKEAESEYMSFRRAAPGLHNSVTNYQTTQLHQVESVSSSLCFDIGILRATLISLKNAGLLRMLKRNWNEGRFIRALINLPFNPDEYVIIANIAGKKEGHPVKARSVIPDAIKTRIIGLVTAEISHIPDDSHMEGEFNIDLQFDLEDVTARLIDTGTLKFVQELI